MVFYPTPNFMDKTDNDLATGFLLQRAGQPNCRGLLLSTMWADFERDGIK
jgi:hypothetical protein